MNQETINKIFSVQKTLFCSENLMQELNKKFECIVPLGLYDFNKKLNSVFLDEKFLIFSDSVFTSKIMEEIVPERMKTLLSTNTLDEAWLRMQGMYKNVNLGKMLDIEEQLKKRYGTINFKYDTIKNSLDIWNELLTNITKNVSNEGYKISLKDVGYIQEKVFKEVNLLSEENKKSINPIEKREELINRFAEKYPVICIVIFIIQFILNSVNNFEIVNNVIIPFVQNAIVELQGNENVYFVKMEEVKIYEEANSKSEVVCIIYYGEKVEKIEDSKMWIKVLYKDEEGIDCVGWIAKRNLMTYNDWKFNSDDLYNIK